MFVSVPKCAHTHIEQEIHIEQKTHRERERQREEGRKGERERERRMINEHHFTHRNTVLINIPVSEKDCHV